MFDNTMSVEQWKEQKQTERNDAFKAQQSCMEEALSSGKALTAYLVGRGRLASLFGKEILIILPPSHPIITPYQA